MVITKIRSRNPQFFKPIISGPFQQLAIPSGFLKYLSDEKFCEEGEAVLRNSGKSWRVKINGFCFKEGWADFARDFDLLIGDFVVFKHEGGLVFDVLVFDNSACEKEYPPLLHPLNEIKREAGKFESRGKEPSLEKKIMNKLKGSTRTHSGALMAAKEYAASCNFETPFFVVPVRKYNLTDYTLCIPKKFAIANGLIGKSFEVILKDHEGESGRSWSVQLTQKRNGRGVLLRSGWHEFAVANHLKKDQLCIFRLISSCNIYEDGKLVFDVTVVDPKPSMSSKNSQIDQEPNYKPSFVTSLQNSILASSLLYVPKKFAINNGLLVKRSHYNITLKDQKGRTWELKNKIYKTRGNFYMKGDWHEISVANGLEEGDDINLQLTSNDAMHSLEFLLL